MSTKAIQGKLWSVAPSYWSQHFEPYFLPVYRKVLDQLQLLNGQLLLDAGCGSGLFSHMAIKAGAEVIGIDAAPGLLEVARKRNPQNNFMEEDLEAMPFADDSFDVVVGFNSFQYAGSFDKALAEAARVLKPGGKLVIVIWDKPELSDGTTVLKEIGKLLPPPPPGTPGPFALSEDGKVEGVCRNTGLQVISKLTVPCAFIYRSLDEGVKSYMGTGPAAIAMNSHSKETVESAIAAALQSFRLVDGMHFMQNQFLVFVATK
jgi:ubiquinone/menaquinone biosynthesis C-methylase UbiE